MSGIVLLILVLVPVIEITLFIQLGGAIGAGWTILLILATAMIGLSAMRRQGMATLASAQLAQAQGRAPVAEVGHGILILLAGVMLFIPGFMTDAIGAVLLWRPARSLFFETALVLIIPSLFAGFGMTSDVGTPGKSTRGEPAEDGIIEGDFTVHEDV